MSEKPKEKPAPSVYSSDKKMKAALKNYLLTNGEGEMGRLINDLLSFHKFRKTAKIVGIQGEVYHTHQQVQDLLENWEIRVEPASDTDHRLELPGVKDRRPDLPLLIAYYFQDFLHRSAAARSSVRHVSLDLLWFMLGHRKWRNSDAVRAAIEKCIMSAQGKVLTLCQAAKSAKWFFGNLFGGFESACKELENSYRERDALKALIEHRSWLEEDVRGEYVEWYLNWDRKEARRDDFEPRVPRIPVNRVFQAMSNIYKLSQLSEDDSALPQQEELSKIKKCFSLRRQGLTEDQIAGHLDMEKWRYQRWTELRSISIRFKQPDRVRRNWISAKDSLFVSSEMPISSCAGTEDKEEDRDKRENGCHKLRITVYLSTNEVTFDDERPIRYNETVVKAAAYALQVQKGVPGTLAMRCFDRVELCDHLKKSSNYKIRDIFRNTRFYPNSPNHNSRLVIWCGQKNKYFLDVDIANSKIIV